MSEASKPTPGPWTVSGLGGPWESTLRIRAPSWGLVAQIGVDPGMPHWDLQQRANAALIAEAGTVHHETGLTPRQLVEQRDALAKALEDVAASLSWLAYGEVKTFHARRIMNPAEATGAARAALTLVKGAKP